MFLLLILACFNPTEEERKSYWVKIPSPSGYENYECMYFLTPHSTACFLKSEKVTKETCSNLQ